MKYLAIAALCLCTPSCETLSLKVAGPGYGVSYSPTDGILVSVHPTK